MKGKWTEAWLSPEAWAKDQHTRKRILNERRADPVKRQADKKTRQAYEKTRDPRAKLISGAQVRSKNASLPFNLTIDDIKIPDRCPALGIPLRPGEGVSHDGSPQLDRLVPELGYVRGNVAVISRLANTIKQNASPKQIRAVADWFEKSLHSLTP